MEVVYLDKNKSRLDHFLTNKVDILNKSISNSNFLFI